MSTHILDAGSFKLVIGLKTFEKDVQYPSNAIMSISVISGDFSASTDMDIDIKQFVLFVMNLKNVYEELDGIAKIEEPYGYHKYISFVASETGHIVVKGYLCDDMKNNEFFFENGFDQTFLKSFVNELVCSYL